MSLQNPDCSHEFARAVIGFKRPWNELRNDFVAWTLRKFADGELTRPAVFGIDLRQQFIDGCAGDFGTRRERTIFRDDTPDAAVGFVAVGIAKACLVMA